MLIYPEAVESCSQLFLVWVVYDSFIIFEEFSSNMRVARILPLAGGTKKAPHMAGLFLLNV